MDKTIDPVWTVYIHTNKENQKKYVGITSTSVVGRWHNGHGYLTKKKDGSFCQPAMAHAILKYGWKSFFHEIIATNLTMDQASEMEKELIEKYQSNKKAFGYNIKSGGIDGILSEESIEKGRKTRTGGHRSEETKRKISESNMGKTHTKETKEQLSQSHSKVKERPQKEVPDNKIYNQVCCKCIETGECFPSISNAAKTVGSYDSNIYKCIIRNRQRAGGYHWEKISKEEYEEYLKTTKNLVSQQV